MTIPKPSATADREGQVPFLKPNHLGRGKRGKLVLLGEARTQKSNFGQQIIVAVKLGAKRFDWPFNENSGNHQRLYKRFGSNPKKWKGPVLVEVKSFNDNKYIAVTD